MGIFILLIVIAAAAVLFVGKEIRSKNLHLWLAGYFRAYPERKKLSAVNQLVHVMFCFVDHFEPPWQKADYATEVSRVNAWVERYPALVQKHQDADGKYPQHTFFYPEEEYRKEHVDKLAQLCKNGMGEVEIHLHHDHDTAQGLTEKLLRFKSVLKGHGLLARHRVTNSIMYGFIHGNWALDNSRKDGRMCGVNNELVILNETGCYADFTLPSAPSDTQTKKINAIYYATDDASRPKSHNDGVDVAAGRKPSGDLMIIQGPLTLNWRDRKWGILPRIENGDISAECPPSPRRVDLWVQQHICVSGRPEWIFIKIHTHGCQERHQEALLGEKMDAMHAYLETKYNDGRHFKLHYVTSREVYNIIKAAEAGETGDPGNYRDYVLVKNEA